MYEVPNLSIRKVLEMITTFSNVSRFENQLIKSVALLYTNSKHTEKKKIMETLALTIVFKNEINKISGNKSSKKEEEPYNDKDCGRH